MISKLSSRFFGLPLGTYKFVRKTTGRDDAQFTFDIEKDGHDCLEQFGFWNYWD